MRKPGSKYRNKAQTRASSSALRAWLVAEFGAAFLRQGSGVLDIGGGKGDFALQITNLHDVPTTIVDPRVPAMQKCQRRLEVRITGVLLRVRCSQAM